MQHGRRDVCRQWHTKGLGDVVEEADVSHVLRDSSVTQKDGTLCSARYHSRHKRFVTKLQNQEEARKPKTTVCCTYVQGSRGGGRG